jgi:type IV pilus assembly protein PilM
LAANLSAQAITTSIANGQDLLLYRTIDLPSEPGHRIEEIQRSIAVAAAYFEDKLGARPRRLHYAGIFKPEDFARMVADPELTIVEWAPCPDEGAMSALPQVNYAGVAGALAGAA